MEEARRYGAAELQVTRRAAPGGTAGPPLSEGRERGEGRRRAGARVAAPRQAARPRPRGGRGEASRAAGRDGAAGLGQVAAARWLPTAGPAGAAASGERSAAGLLVGRGVWGRFGGVLLPVGLFPTVPSQPGAAGLGGAAPVAARSERGRSSPGCPQQLPGARTALTARSCRATVRCAGASVLSERTDGALGAAAVIRWWGSVGRGLVGSARKPEKKTKRLRYVAVPPAGQVGIPPGSSPRGSSWASSLPYI